MGGSSKAGVGWRGLLACIGPGILLAGAAIGVSHLVQATRAGAEFGFGMLGLLVLACVTKYPFLEFGPRYAAATGEDLVEGYRRLGRWAVWTCAAVTLGSMFIIMAAVTAVTAALARFVVTMYLPVQWPALVWNGVVIAMCLAVLLVGRYRVLERTMKIVMAVLLLSTVAAVVVAATGEGPVIAEPVEVPAWWAMANFGFVLAFMGWMPIPIDSAIWNSIWVREHGRARGRPMTLKEALFDYRVGYITAGVVAVLFLSLGALVMFGRGERLAAGGAGFAQQLITVYGDTLGTWSVPLVAAAALTTMFSTTLVVLDAFPRAMQRLVQAVRDVPPEEAGGSRGRGAYIGWVLAQAGLGWAILSFFGGGLRAMVDLATTLSFLTAPVLAVINYLVITRLAPEEARPGRAMRWWSVGSIGFLGVFSGAYVVWLVGR
jgi:Mn2+/Fe2+ NRAMP family transporter